MVYQWIASCLQKLHAALCIIIGLTGQGPYLNMRHLYPYIVPTIRSCESEANRSVNSPFGQNYMATDPVLAATVHASPAAASAVHGSAHGSGQKDSAAAHAQDAAQGGEHSGAVAGTAMAGERAAIDGTSNGVPQ
jgi:hypothetical protein